MVLPPDGRELPAVPLGLHAHEIRASGDSCNNAGRRRRVPRDPRCRDVRPIVFGRADRVF